MLLVTRVAGDGDCLFHALGLPDSYDGNALRIEVADFMEARAPGLPAADQQLWLLEAEKLRGNRWAGHTAAVAYSAFKQRRVLIHQRRGEGAAPRVEDATHASVLQQSRRQSGGPADVPQSQLQAEIRGGTERARA